MALGLHLKQKILSKINIKVHYNNDNIKALYNVIIMSVISLVTALVLVLINKIICFVGLSGPLK